VAAGVWATLFPDLRRADELSAAALLGRSRTDPEGATEAATLK